jgi:tartrate-resistant acid phosphatase type 5
VSLGPPAPNPARRALAFSVVLPRELRVQLRVVDIGGRVVRTLQDGVMPAGQHRLTWDAAGRDGPVLSSGVYFLAMDVVFTPILASPGLSP